MDLREEKVEDLKHLDIHCFKRDLTPDTFVNLLDYHDLKFCIEISISVSTHALDLSQRTIRADDKIVNELKIKKQADTALRFLKGTDTNAVMESGYNYYLYDLLKSKGYNVKVAHPLMVKAKFIFAFFVYLH